MDLKAQNSFPRESSLHRVFSNSVSLMSREWAANSARDRIASNLILITTVTSKVSTGLSLSSIYQAEMVMSCQCSHASDMWQTEYMYYYFHQLQIIVLHNSNSKLEVWNTILCMSSCNIQHIPKSAYTYRELYLKPDTPNTASYLQGTSLKHQDSKQWNSSIWI